MCIGSGEIQGILIKAFTVGRRWSDYSEMIRYDQNVFEIIKTLFIVKRIFLDVLKKSKYREDLQQPKTWVNVATTANDVNLLTSVDYYYCRRNETPDYLDLV